MRASPRTGSVASLCYSIRRVIATLSTIGLLLSYKFNTKIGTHMFASYCEQHGILSEPQEGFRKFKSCKRQLQYFKLALDDANLCRQDICMCLLDIKAAFNSVDHAFFAYWMLLKSKNSCRCASKH